MKEQSKTLPMASYWIVLTPMRLGWIFQSNILEVIGLTHYSKINLALPNGLYLSLNPFLVDVLSV